MGDLCARHVRCGRCAPPARAVLVCLLAVAGVGIAGGHAAAADNTFTVTSTADDGSTGTLRWAINQANAAGAGTQTIEFALTPNSTVTLSSALPILDNPAGNIAIDGTGATALAISGAGANRVFFVASGNVAIANMAIINGFARGGNGGEGSTTGGGGLGAGGALFVNTSANVTLQNVAFDNNAAHGGNAGALTFSGPGGGGGGGLGGNGGNAAGYGGGGGGGFLGNGGNSGASSGSGGGGGGGLLGNGGNGEGGGGGGGGVSSGSDAFFGDGGAGSSGAAGGSGNGENGETPLVGGGGGGALGSSGGNGGSGGLLGGGGGGGYGGNDGGNHGGDGGNGSTYGGGGGSGNGHNFQGPGTAGYGGDFGGGGGASWSGIGSDDGGAGGFGGGGGGGKHGGGYGGSGGFGGGEGGGEYSGHIRGNGGSGYGGAVFVLGSLTVIGSNTANSAVEAGDGAQSGDSAGQDLYLLGGPTIFDQAGSSFSGSISGYGDVLIQGMGTTLFTGTNTYFGRTIVNDTARLQGNSNSLQGAITNNSNVTFDQTFDGTYAGAMDGTGALFKTGSGNLILSGANTYTGGTTVSEGILTGTSTSLQGAITNNAQVTFDQAFDGSYSGAMSGTGSLFKTGIGNLILAGANTYGGGTTVSGGILTGTSTSLQGAITNNAQVTFDQAFDGSYSGAMSGTGSLVKTGTGNLTLVGVNPFSGQPNNSYTGGTTVSAGTLTGTSYSLQGNILNNAQVVFDQNGFAWSYSGNISGSGNVVVTDGIVQFFGTNSYTGGTSVIDASLVGDTNNLQGNINQSNSAVLFYQTFDGTYAGSLSGSGSLYKQGSGSLNLTGTNTVTQVQVDGGRLAVNGTLNSDSLFVLNGSVLGGNGTINGNLVNLGTVGPGNSIGTLTVNGAYDVGSGAVQRVEIDADGNTPGVNNDLLVVNGITTLNGGTVNVQAAPGTYTPGIKYTFLETLALSGTYSGVTGFSDPSLHAVLGYGQMLIGSDTYYTAYVELLAQSNFASIATTYNQLGVATYIDDNSINATPGMQSLIDTLYTLSVPEQQAALNMLTAEVNGTIAQLQVQDTTFMYTMLRRRVGSAFATGGLVESEGDDEGGFFAAGSAKSGGTVRTVSFNPTGSSFNENSSNSSLISTASNCASSPWSGWTAGYGLGGNAQGDGNAAGGVYGAGGTILAMERLLDERSLVGLFGGYSGMSLHLSGLPQSASANQGQFGGYFLRDMGRTYLLAAGSAGFTGYRESRQMTFGNINSTASGSYSGWNPSAYLEKGIRLPLGRTMLQPYGALQYIYVRQNSFTETGAGTLNQAVAGIDTNALRGILGSRLSQNFRTAGGQVFIPEVRAAWMHEFLAPETTLNATFAPVGGASFATQGLNFGRDWALLGAGTQYVFNNSVSLFANYDLQVNTLQAWHAGSGGLQFLW